MLRTDTSRINCLLLPGVLVFALGAPGPAQGAPRDDFVFHVYVDPIYGDNEAATLLNPTNPDDLILGPLTHAVPQPNMLPLDPHSDPSISLGTGTKMIEGYLQHAPYAFKTLTSTGGGLGAVEYANRLFYQPPAGVPPWPVPPLPWTSPLGKRVTHVVIHCLPGLYGPDYYNPGEIDAESGLRWNGESFPITLGPRIPYFGMDVSTDRISIQGTSALDTIFDARGTIRPIFEVTALLDPAGGASHGHEGSFIDGLTLRGATSNGVAGTASGAAIHILGWTTNFVSVTNCFIAENSVGIAIDGDYLLVGTQQFYAQHNPRIVNNTFAENVVGVWAGYIDTNHSLNNNHDPIVLNNVFVTNTNGPGSLRPLSCFEGLYPPQLTVATVGPNSDPVNAAINAWDTTAANVGGVLVANFPASPIALPLPTPAVDTSQYSLLFIRDLFFASPIGGSGAHYSRHDYRLLPMALGSGGATTPNVINPLVDRAIYGSDVVMANGERIASADGPGLPSDAEEVVMAGWDFDAEGFGNSRVNVRPDVPVPPIEWFSMDLGADESSNLVVAGFLPGTRIFAPSGIPNTAFSDHLDIYFVDMVGPAPHLRPMYNAVFSACASPPCVHWPWFEHAQNTPDVPVGAPYPFTDGQFNSARWLFYTGGQRELFMRNLQCDFAPHVSLDARPLWPELLRAMLPGPPEIGIHSTNAWYGTGLPPVYVQADNPSLFFNKGYAVHGTPNPVYHGGQTFVATSTLNPPGTIPAPPPLSRLLDPKSPFLSIGSGGCPSGSAVYQVDAWGVSTCPDRINPPGSIGIGYRLNMEGLIGDMNVQTLLVVPYESQAAASGGGLVRPPSPSVRSLQDAMERVRGARR